MSKILVIVESPGKIKKISDYLGPNYIVKASFGHVQDLDKNTLSIDVNDNFKPYYITTPDKKAVVKDLIKFSKECSDVILAADGDREGEAIAHSLATVLKLKEPKRIIFHEITKTALLKALEKPIKINYDMVNAQQTRRLLDRLVGYKISPILWQYLSKDAKSAGRVQSVVVKIIIDLEKEINKSISKSYFKTLSEFMFGDTKLNSLLQYENKMFQFENKEQSKDFLTLINKKFIIKVKSVENKKSIRKASAPFITSSLQQEASNKLHYNVKRTMDIAQKLYENGLITYMRTDSPNISKEAMKEAEEYIIKTFGKEYSDSKNYESKGASQDAHECIRPTHLNIPEPDGIDGDMKKLYSLIWKRTIASQMANAKINIQVIQIDILNKKESVLLIDDKQCYFVSNLENVEFPGYLIVYDNTLDDEEKTIGKIEIKTKQILELNNITITEEYTKPPSRYNEASLVRYLEKNGIGRPSTYASIISKVIERKYIEIKNIDGIEKDSEQIILNSDYKIKEDIKKVYIGKEQTKLVSTNMGNQVNDFMCKNFEPILGIDFTSNFETYLDKIASGNANWITVLRTFYDMFEPIVEKLNSQIITEKKDGNQVSDRLLGVDSNNKKIYTGTGKYGPYVKIETDDSKKWRYCKLTEMTIENVDIEHALKLLEFPKMLGKLSGAIVSLNDGPHGLYLKYNGKNYSIKDKKIDEINIDIARGIIEQDPFALKSFKVSNKIINIKNGEFGNYIQIVSNNKKQNISIPTKYNIDTITIDDVLKIISDKNGVLKKK